MLYLAIVFGAVVGTIVTIIIQERKRKITGELRVIKTEDGDHMVLHVYEQYKHLLKENNFIYLRIVNDEFYTQE